MAICKKCLELPNRVIGCDRCGDEFIPCETKNSWKDIQLAFYYGIGIGIIIGCAVSILLMVII